ncbi:archaemetzincin family Zn-dependent metalloprotease [Candidatus Bathyarchaeota archaeon]|nr:archaemetzincin family Zn-dependent metalloprotease [Candidatus Bathyarchaeota archaeon]
MPVGTVDRKVLAKIANDLLSIFPRSSCLISRDTLPIPAGAYNVSRRQYLSEMILRDIRRYAEEHASERPLSRFLGVVDVDIYAPGLNFIFGEAEFLGKAALISLYRLKPEFYGKPSNWSLFTHRAVKEAVHEIGHTLGLRHCSNPTCVMHFSLHIGMTDMKREDFCPLCRRRVEEYIGRYEP